MDYDGLKEKLNQLKIEDYIWLIYIGIIFLSWYSNSLERNYFVYKNEESKKKYRTIMIIIFSILVIVYLYFLKDSFNSLKSINPFDPKKKKDLLFLSFFASLLIFISGLIFLYIALTDEDLNVELAFN
ncbi:MAG: hypothetical protein E7158_02310 [Firmicutes bacterium]|nr:hypothetical protein [Bacillota bacterium]